VRACQTNSSLAADKVLDDLIFQACSNIPSRDKSTLHSVIGRVSARGGMKARYFGPQTLRQYAVILSCWSAFR
jgi:hypothetical protein